MSIWAITTTSSQNFQRPDPFTPLGETPVITITITRGDATITDEYLGPIDGLAARVAAIRAGLDGALPRADVSRPFRASLDATSGSCDEARGEALKGPQQSSTGQRPVRVLSSGAVVTTAPRPLEQPWTGTRLFAWSKTRDGSLEFVQSYGSTHGFPARIAQWSPIMCERAYQAWLKERSVVA